MCRHMPRHVPRSSSTAEIPGGSGKSAAAVKDGLFELRPLLLTAFCKAHTRQCHDHFISIHLSALEPRFYMKATVDTLRRKNHGGLLSAMHGFPRLCMDCTRAALVCDTILPGNRTGRGGSFLVLLIKVCKDQPIPMHVSIGSEQGDVKRRIM